MFGCCLVWEVCSQRLAYHNLPYSHMQKKHVDDGQALMRIQKPVQNSIRATSGCMIFCVSIHLSKQPSGNNLPSGNNICHVSDSFLSGAPYLILKVIKFANLALAMPTCWRSTLAQHHTHHHQVFRALQMDATAAGGKAHAEHGPSSHKPVVQGARKTTACGVQQVAPPPAHVKRMLVNSPSNSPSKMGSFGLI